MTIYADLTDPSVVGMDGAIALAHAVVAELKAAKRLEPGRHDDALARLAGARPLIAELEAELDKWAQSS